MKTAIVKTGPWKGYTQKEISKELKHRFSKRKTKEKPMVSLQAPTEMYDLSRMVQNAFFKGACMKCLAITFDKQQETIEHIVRSSLRR